MILTPEQAYAIVCKLQKRQSAFRLSEFTHDCIRLFRGENHGDYGRSSFDRTHVFVGNFLYELPFGARHRLASNATGFRGKLVGGWRLGAIALKGAVGRAAKLYLTELGDPFSVVS